MHMCTRWEGEERQAKLISIFLKSISHLLNSWSFPCWFEITLLSLLTISESKGSEVTLSKFPDAISYFTNSDNNMLFINISHRTYVKLIQDNRDEHLEKNRDPLVLYQQNKENNKNSSQSFYFSRLKIISLLEKSSVSIRKSPKLTEHIWAMNVDNLHARFEFGFQSKGKAEGRVQCRGRSERAGPTDGRSVNLSTLVLRIQEKNRQIVSSLRVKGLSPIFPQLHMHNGCLINAY